MCGKLFSAIPLSNVTSTLLSDSVLSSWIESSFRTHLNPLKSLCGLTTDLGLCPPRQWYENKMDTDHLMAGRSVSIDVVVVQADACGSWAELLSQQEAETRCTSFCNLQAKLPF